MQAALESGDIVLAQKVINAKPKLADQPNKNRTRPLHWINLDLPTQTIIDLMKMLATHKVYLNKTFSENLTLLDRLFMS